MMTGRQVVFTWQVVLFLSSNTYTHFMLLRVTEELEHIQTVIGQKVGNTLKRSTVHHRTTQRHMRQITVLAQSNEKLNNNKATNPTLMPECEWGGNWNIYTHTQMHWKKITTLTGKNCNTVTLQTTTPTCYIGYILLWFICFVITNPHKPIHSVNVLMPLCM